MSGPDRIIIFGIPESLHDALRNMTTDLTDLSQLIGGVQAAYQDVLKSYGSLVAEVATHVRNVEEEHDVTAQIEAALADVGATRASGPATGTVGHPAVDSDFAEATQEYPGGPVGDRDARTLHAACREPDCPYCDY